MPLGTSLKEIKEAKGKKEEKITIDFEALDNAFEYAKRRKHLGVHDKDMVVLTLLKYLEYTCKGRFNVSRKVIEILEKGLREEYPDLYEKVKEYVKMNSS